jgi:hypothetical protein
VNGESFSIAGGTSLPVSIAAGGTYSLTVNFNPAATGPANGQLSIAHDASTNGATVISLSGKGTATAQASVALGALSCASASMIGSGKDVCTVTLNQAVPSGGVVVSLSSSDPSVVVPETAAVLTNQTSAQFTAKVSPVSVAQAVVLTASAGGASMNFALQLSAYVPTLQTSSTSIAFGTVALNTPTTRTVGLTSAGTAPLTISAATLTGSGFSISGVAFPLTLNPGKATNLSVQFDPSVAGAAAGQLTLSSNSSTNGTAVIALSGTGQASSTVALSAISCATSSFTGAGTDVCTVTLNSSAPSGGALVTLSTNNPAVIVPSSASIPMNGTSAQFTATVSSVLTSQTVAVTASEGGTTMNASLQLNAYVPTLQISSASVAFGSAVLNTPTTRPLTLTSVGSAPVVVSTPSLTGSGFSVSGAVFPLTLNPSQAATLNIQFNPTAAGAVSGQLTLSSNSSTNGTAIITLSGTGQAQASLPGALSAISCTIVSFTGGGKDVCTVTLGSPAPIGGTLVTLSTNNAAVVAPTSAWIPMNGTGAQFTANVLPVLTTQSVAITASSNSVTMNFALQLNAYVPTLQISSTSVAFGAVALNTLSTWPLSLSSVGNAPVVVTAPTVTGNGFSISGVTFPLYVNPGHTTILSVQFDPAVAGAAAGQLTISSTSSTDGTVVIALSGTGKSITSFPYSGSPLVNTQIPLSADTPISSDFFGMTIQRLGTTPFPAFPFSTFRLWDVAVWSIMEPSSGQFVWTKMDNSIAIAQNNGVKDFIFTFGSVPVWASTNPSDPCTNGDGIGSCATPDMAAFDDFTTRVVQRYCGKVRYYETWNEANNSSYWSGTNAQLLTIAQHLNQIAKDPANCGCANGVCAPNGGANPNQVLTPSISRVTSANLSWFDSYLAGTGAQYPYADVVSFHGYEISNPENIATEIPSLNQTLAKHGLSNLQLWNTEASWGSMTSVGQPQVSWLMRYHVLLAMSGVSRFIWYSYDNCGWGTLWETTFCSNPQMPVGQLTDPGKSYAVIENWLVGAALSSCRQYANGLWACELQRTGGYEGWMLWSSAGTDITVPITEDSGLTVYRDWQNKVNALPMELTVGQIPVLLENHDF